MNYHQESEGYDEAVQISELYTDELYTQMLPQQGNLGEGKRRRRRKKNRESEGTDAVGKKRRLTTAQVHLLERNFGREQKLESERKECLAVELGLDPRQVAVWFQNRRARWRNKKLEEEYCNLKKLHESVVLEKYHLETQLLMLKEQLSEVEKEKERLIMGVWACGPSSCSPSPLMPMDAVDPTCLGEFEASFENTCLYGMEFADSYI